MVVMAECIGPDLPVADDVVYFEIPEAIDPLTSFADGGASLLV